MQRGGWVPPRTQPSRATPQVDEGSEVFDEELLSPDAPLDERIAQMIRFEESREASFLSEFNAESVDGDWAATWESNLTTNLEGALSQIDGFDGMSVECRKERCLAEAKWKNYAAAEVGMNAASDATKGACATAVFIRPPEDREAPYQHSVRFSHCQDAPS